jgi:Zn finger protein HypA/HybF involved in hydrogenase expression
MCNRFNWRERKNTYYHCDECKVFTKPDEWASETRCINCGPKESEISEMDKYIEENIIVGEN